MADTNIQSKQMKRYKFLRTEHTRLQGLENKNVIQADIECLFLEEKNEQQYYHLKITNLQQSNTKGMYGLIQDLQTLKSNIVVAISEEGRIEAVLNMEEIRAKWQVVKDKIMDRHKSKLYEKDTEEKITELLKSSEQFADSLKYLPPFVSLFSGFSTQTGTEEHYREMPFFIAKDKMPIILKSRKTKKSQIADTAEIIAKGKLDEDNYEHPEVTRFVKIARDNLRAKSVPKLRYLERYAFNDSSLPVQTLCMSTVTIPGFLQQNETSILKEVL